MKKRRDLVIRLVAAALSLTFVITLFPFTVFADNNSSPVTSDDLLDIDGTTPAGYSSTDTTNPYGLKAGRTVQSVAQSELLMSMSQYSNNTYTNSWQAFDTYSSGVNLLVTQCTLQRPFDKPYGRKRATLPAGLRDIIFSVTAMYSA
jgi:hypothetical protein